MHFIRYFLQFYYATSEATVQFIYYLQQIYLIFFSHYNFISTIIQKKNLKIGIFYILGKYKII